MDEGQLCRRPVLGRSRAPIRARTAQPAFYGFPFKVDLKSLVWYVPDNFKDAGYQVPQTQEDLMALSAKMVADGHTPWCIGLGSGSATGWPGTDWVEEYMLRTQPPEVYDQWVKNEIKFDDPRVLAAIDLFGKFVHTDGWVYGGPQGVVTQTYKDIPKELFTVPPHCYMHRQASFITSFFPDNVVLGQDADFFYFPPFASHPELGKPVEGGGTIFTITKDSPATRAFIDYLKTTDANEVWMGLSGFLTARKGINLARLRQRHAAQGGPSRAQRHHLPLRRLRPDARRGRRGQLLVGHGRLRRRQIRQRRGGTRSRQAGTRSSRLERLDRANPARAGFVPA